MVNPMGTKGNLANAFANILRDMWQGEGGTLSPVTFRVSSSHLLRMCIAPLTPTSVLHLLALALQPRAAVLRLRAARLAGIFELPT